jgi:Phosphoglycerate dehydrogenase and related dehydrogenases
MRVVIAVPIDPTLVDRMRAARPDVEWVWLPELLPVRRHPADYVGAPGFERSEQQQAEYDALIDSADILFGLPDTDPTALRRTVAANPNLRWVHTMAAGGGAQIRAAGLSADQLDELVVTTSAGVHPTGLAEFALLGLLAGAKDLPRLERDQRAAVWPDRAPVRQLAGSIVLVLGVGGIGRRVAELAAAFGAQSWGLTHRQRVELPEFSRLLDRDHLFDSLAEVDAVVACLPGTDATEHLIDARFLGALKKGVTLVNVGRGSVVDERALIDALDSGQVGFAALDVFETEPLPASSRLWSCEQVLISPHTAALDTGEEERIVELFLDNLSRWTAGRPLRNLMNRAEYY